jgi:hypothetical protein
MRNETRSTCNNSRSTIPPHPRDRLAKISTLNSQPSTRFAAMPKLNPDTPREQLLGLSINRFAQLMCYEYITKHDIRALNVLQNTWPQHDWLTICERLKNPDHLTINE